MYREDKARQQRNQKGNQKRKQFSCNGTGNRNNQQPPEKKRRGVVSLVALAPFGDPDTSSKPSLRTSPSPSRVFRCLLATLTRRCRFNIAQKPSAAAAALHLFPTLSFFEGGGWFPGSGTVVEPESPNRSSIPPTILESPAVRGMPEKAVFIPLASVRKTGTTLRLPRWDR